MSAPRRRRHAPSVGSKRAFRHAIRQEFEAAAQDQHGREGEGPARTRDTQSRTLAGGSRGADEPRRGPAQPARNRKS